MKPAELPTPRATRPELPLQVVRTHVRAGRRSARSSFPAAVVGPVDLKALRRLAAIRRRLGCRLAELWLANSSLFFNCQ